MSDAITREWPAGAWVPHQPDTWPFVFGTVKHPTKLQEWIDHKRDERGEPIFVDRWIPAGAKVRIVMVSRLGDIGITDDLAATHGYLARVSLDHLVRVP